MVDGESSTGIAHEAPVLVGASAHSSGEEQGDETTEDLPMVVWLRGDEPYADEFCLDADAAMQEIGIRRSRLTQISGKELRVGRMRIDRYVRPVYRRVDIEEYKQWTRATASHLRSSNVLEEASKKLEMKVHDIESSMEEKVERVREDLERQLDSFTQQLDHQAEHLSAKIKEFLGNEIISLRQSFQSVEANVFDQIESLKEDFHNISPEDLDLAFAQVREPVGELRDGQTRLLSFVQDLTELLTPLEEIRDHLVNDLQEVGPALGELYAQFYDSATHTKDALDSQNRFNRKMADMLTSVVECQREALLKQQALLVRVSRVLDERVPRPTEARSLRRVNVHRFKRRRLRPSI